MERLIEIRTAWLLAAIALFAGLGGLGGCATVRVTDPPRTATEQFLLSGAGARAVAQLDFGPMQGRKVFVDTQYFAAAEQPFVLGELRARLLLAGVHLVPLREESEVVMEVRSSGVGIDREDLLIGLPAMVLTSDNTGSISIPFTTPEIALLKNIEQWGIASVAYVAYWTATGEALGSSGPYVGWTTRDDWWYFGFGPETKGNIPPIDPPAIMPRDVEIPPAPPQDDDVTAGDAGP